MSVPFVSGIFSISKIPHNTSFFTFFCIFTYISSSVEACPTKKNIVINRRCRPEHRRGINADLPCEITALPISWGERRLLSGFLNSEFCILVFCCFLLFFVYYLNKGVIHLRMQNFLESPFFVFPHLL